LIELIISFPSFSQNRKAYISLLINVWVQNFIETLDLRLRKWVIGKSFVGESNFGVCVCWSLWRQDRDVQLNYRVRIRERYLYIWDFVLLISCDILLHSLLRCLWLRLFLLLFLLFFANFFESFNHG
jgi:hypothetical protein